MTPCYPVFFKKKKKKKLKHLLQEADLDVSTNKYFESLIKKSPFLQYVT